MTGATRRYVVVFHRQWKRNQVFGPYDWAEAGDVHRDIVETMRLPNRTRGRVEVLQLESAEQRPRAAAALNPARRQADRP